MNAVLARRLQMRLPTGHRRGDQITVSTRIRGEPRLCRRPFRLPQYCNGAQKRWLAKRRDRAWGGSAKHDRDHRIFGERGGDRTLDHMIKSHVLYH